MSGAKHKIKGDRVEREIVNMLRTMGIWAERVPLSGASRYQGEGHDINVYPWGRNGKTLVLEIKARKEGAGFTLLKRWLADYDGLITREDRQEPLVTLPWQIFAELLVAVGHSIGTRPKPKNGLADAISRRPVPSDEGDNYVDPES